MLSICIPTYNRPVSLNNCLNSIKLAKENFKTFDFEVCISDNSDNEKNFSIIEKYKKEFKINYIKNRKIWDLEKMQFKLLTWHPKNFHG